MNTHKDGHSERYEHLVSTGQTADIGMVDWHLIFANGSRVVVSEVEPKGAVEFFEKAMQDAYMVRDNPSKAEGLVSKEDAPKYIEIWENTVVGEIHAVMHPAFVQKLVEAGVELPPL